MPQPVASPRTSYRDRSWRAARGQVLVALTAGTLGCAARERSEVVVDSAGGVDTAQLAVDVEPRAVAFTARHRRPAKLSPLADSISQRLVFAPARQTWFLGAVREKVFGIDVGRVDFDVRKTAGRMEAFRVAVRETSPLEVGTRLRLRGPWGQEDVSITTFDAVGGRVVARVRLSGFADSLLRASTSLVASAERVTESASSSLSSCDRSMSDDLRKRLSRLADSLETLLKKGEQPTYVPWQKSLRTRKSIVAGCFGNARGLAMATLYAGDYEWARERAFLLGDANPASVTIRDLRFRSHEAIHALDADGDGIDEVATRAWTPRGSGTVILRLTEGSVLERLAAGFAVER